VQVRRMARRKRRSTVFISWFFIFPGTRMLLPNPIQISLYQ